MIFGVQPCVWAEQFITPARTEVMQFLYLNFFWIAPSTSVILLARAALSPSSARRPSASSPASTSATPSTSLFPAAPPRLVLVYEFTKNLRGYPVGFSNLSAQAFALLPVDSRAAFPSLHAAVSLVALVYAWRYVRRLVLGAAAVRPRALGLDHLPPPPLRRGPGGRLAARPAGGLGGAAARRLVGAAAAGARLRAGPRGALTAVREDAAARIAARHFAGWTFDRPGLGAPGQGQVGAPALSARTRS